MHDMPCVRVRSVIIPPVAKSVNYLTYILFSAFVTSKEINQAFLDAVNFMINFVSFSCNRTGKTVHLINICTNLALWSFKANIFNKFFAEQCTPLKNDSRVPNSQIFLTQS